MDKQFSEVRAIYKPADEHRHTLIEEAKPFIGTEAIFQYSWLMDEEDKYPGVWALIPRTGDEDFRCLGWIPEFDLEILHPPVFFNDGVKWS